MTSGYTAQIAAILLVNIATAYAAYVPLACVQRDLGMSSFMTLGVYVSAFVSGHGDPVPIFSGASSSGTCSAASAETKLGHTWHGGLVRAEAFAFRWSNPAKSRT